MAIPLIRNTRASATGTAAIGLYVHNSAAVHNSTLRGSSSDITLEAAATLNADNADYTSITIGAAAVVNPLAGDRAVFDALDNAVRHTNDTDDSAAAIHHTLGTGADQAATGNHAHAGMGTVTSIAAGTGITATPDPIVTTGTIAIANTAVTPGSYKTSNITVDQQGRLTAASNGALDDLSDVNAPTPSNGQALIWDTGSGKWIPGSAAHVIQDEGVTLPTEPNLNFAGSGVIASDDAGNTATLITIEATFNVYNEIQTGTGGVTYYLANEAEPDTVRAYVNGIRQPAENGATASDVVTFSVAPVAGDTLIFDYELAVA